MPVRLSSPAHPREPAFRLRSDPHQELFPPSDPFALNVPDNRFPDYLTLIRVLRGLNAGHPLHGAVPGQDPRQGHSRALAAPQRAEAGLVRTAGNGRQDLRFATVRDPECI